MQTKICLNCKTEYPKNRNMSKPQFAKSKFCSHKCFGIWYKPFADKRFKNPLTHPRWQGGRYLSTHGYIKSYTAEAKSSHGRREYEHRVIMEKYLGRTLNYNEIVHHLNHDKTDNRLENLQLVTRSEHILMHNACQSPEAKLKKELKQRQRNLNLTMARFILNSGAFLTALK